jgi:hypothetical protein
MVRLQIFAPYNLEFVKTEWWSAYPIGQRLVNKYDVQGRVFMAGGEPQIDDKRYRRTYAEKPLFQTHATPIRPKPVRE